jgi:hypothetical protein
VRNILGDICSLLEIYARFGGTYCLRLQDRRMKMEASGFFEMSVSLNQYTFQKTIFLYIPEDNILISVIVHKVVRYSVQSQITSVL